MWLGSARQVALETQAEGGGGIIYQHYIGAWRAPEITRLILTESAASPCAHALQLH